MLRHHRRQPSLDSLPIVERDSLCVFRAGGGKVEHKRLWPFVPCPGDGRQIHLHAASEGFLIVSKAQRFYICNPTIREHALLPQPELGKDIYNTVLGLYRHSPTGEYRMLWCSLRDRRKEARLHVLKVGDDEPRRVRVILPTVSSPSIEQRLLYRLYICSYCPPVHHHGNLH